jgi:hypothetical protein
MQRNDDIEFVTDSGDALPDESELLVGGSPRRPVSRRTVLGGLLAVVLVAAAGAAIRNGSHNTPQNRPPFSATKLSVPPAPNRPTASPLPADAVPLPVTGPVLDIAVGGSSLYVLQPARLTVLDVHTFRELDHTELPKATLAGYPKIVLDPTGRRVWIVTNSDAVAQIAELDGRTLNVLNTTSSTTGVDYAAAMDGVLYISSSAGISALAPNDLTPVIVVKDRYTGPLVADPQRHRLLTVRFGQPSDVIALSVTGQPLADAPLHMTKGDVVVTGDTVWEVGFGANGAVLRTLDPATLRETSSGDLDPAFQLGAGAVVASAGRATLWVRSGGGNADQDVLWCRDAHGEVVSWWTAPGTVAAAQGVVFVADNGILRAIRPVGNCTS